MPTAEQVKALIRSHLSHDSERFTTVALQVAAHEAQHGHVAFANEIRQMVDRARREQRTRVPTELPVELLGLVRTEMPHAPLSALVLPLEATDRLARILHEYLQRALLKRHGLLPRRKILLIGPPGTGKTLTARVLAHQLKLPLHTVLVDRLASRFMGETGARLRQVFELLERSEGVYFFDEFDAIGGSRGLPNDVGEMRRVLTALLQFIEEDQSDGLIVAATNSPDLLDRALYRRFDDVLYYNHPDAPARKRLITNTVAMFLPKRFAWEAVIAACTGLSSAEIVLACRDAVKRAVLDARSTIVATDLIDAFRDRSPPGISQVEE